MRRTALGVAVGVDGREGTAVFFARLFGVAGASVGTPSSAEVGCGAFLLRDLVAGAEAEAGGITAEGASLPSAWTWAWALRRADRRLDMVKFQVSLAGVTTRAGCDSLCAVARSAVENCESPCKCECIELAWKGRATAMRFNNKLQVSTSSSGIRMAPGTASRFNSTRQFSLVCGRKRRHEHRCVE